MDKKANNVNGFWRLRRAAAIGFGIGEKNGEWYVNGAQKIDLLNLSDVSAHMPEITDSQVI